MSVVMVRSVRLGEGIPKICIPIVGKTREELQREAANALDLGADLVEWRVDCFSGVYVWDEVAVMLRQLRQDLGETPLLFTFRSQEEGGACILNHRDYEQLLSQAISSGNVDLVDVELFSGDELVKEMIKKAHNHGVAVILSSHDFQKTPAKEELIRRLSRMEELGADLPKLAVMPVCWEDVLTLLSATGIMADRGRPVITMAMGQIGMISRVAGEVFGSAVTFGAGVQASAPGQIEAGKLREILELIHGNSQKNFTE